jgi:hypothetical protein
VSINPYLKHPSQLNRRSSPPHARTLAVLSWATLTRRPSGSSAKDLNHPEAEARPPWAQGYLARTERLTSSSHPLQSGHPSTTRGGEQARSCPRAPLASTRMHKRLLPLHRECPLQLRAFCHNAAAAAAASSSSSGGHSDSGTPSSSYARSAGCVGKGRSHDIASSILHERHARGACIGESIRVDS